ncbi:MAG: polymer-forming cytoskeletal protein [Comamonas sp.]|jgi:cytoskeletal protein CcmA (bactofilin family)
MAVQNPFFGGRRDNDNSASKFLGGSSSSSSGSTLPSTAAGSASSVLGGNLGSKAEDTTTPFTSSISTTVTTDITSSTTGSKLTVGPNIKLKGVEITDCDTLVVEGTVEATMDSRVIQIAANGAFRGSAEIDIAEIHGEFEGNLTVREKLVIFGSGRVHGKIRYGKVIIEEGGQLTGEIECSNSTRKPSAPVPTKAESEKAASMV